MKLYIIRHGETDYNKAFKLQGQSDIPLNEYGRELARITADGLIDITFDKIYSSPLSRAYETADIIRGNRNVKIIRDDRLKEISFGDYEGTPREERSEEFSNFFFAPDKYVPPHNGESFENVIARAKSFIDEVIYPHRNEDITVAIVAHAAINKALLLNFRDVPLSDYWKGEFQKNCCVHICELDENSFNILEEAKIFYGE